MEIGLPRSDFEELQYAKVTKQMVDCEGEKIGKANINPILDSRMFEVEYLDGTTEVMAANSIAENVMAQVDDDGYRQMLMDEIVDQGQVDSLGRWIQNER